MKSTKKTTSDAVTTDVEDVMAWTPTTPGIAKPLVIAAAGSEGARAAREYHTFGAGQISAMDEACDYPSPDKWNKPSAE
jgi:hypothetical protein